MVREGMRGDDQQQNHMFSYLSPEMRVRRDHPLRAIRVMVDEVLTQLARVVEQARAKGLTSDEHFTVDGTLVEAWASAKSFQPKEGKQKPPDDPGNPTVNFRGEQRSNETHASKSDSEALLARKSGGKESKLSYSGNLLVENRNGLPGRRNGGTRCDSDDAGTDSGNEAGDGGWRQGV
jgi:hypothetical protein